MAISDDYRAGRPIVYVDGAWMIDHRPKNERDAETSALKIEASKHAADAETVRRERDSLIRENARLRETLRGIAAVASDIPDAWDDAHQCVTECGHFRRARAALLKDPTHD